MNLTEERKQPLRELDPSKKRNMLIMNYKGSVQESKSKFDRPADYITYLSQPDLPSSKQFNCTESLRVALTNNTLKWVNEFGAMGGLVVLTGAFVVVFHFFNCYLHVCFIIFLQAF